MAQYRVYEDFQPPHDWARDERSDTLILPLIGFSRSQLKVQIITSARKIRVSGERQIEGNKWRRVYIEFPLPQDSDTNDIGAKFERGTLYVKFPKIIAPAVTPPQPSPPAGLLIPPPSPPPPPPPPPKPTTREEPKAEEAIKKKPETEKDETKMEQKEKEPPKEYKKKEDVSEGKELKEEEAKAKAPETREDRKKQGEESRRAPFSEGLSSMQDQDYKDAIVGWFGELKKQKNVINRLVVVFVVLLLGLYLKHLIVSSFGGSSKSHQEL